MRSLAVAVVLAACGGGPAVLTVGPSSHAFGSVGVGDMGADVAFTVANPGGTATGPVALSIADSQFAITANTCYGAIAAGESCEVTVHFAPTATGKVTSSLEIKAGPGLFAGAVLTGTGLAPAALAITPALWDFGHVQLASNVITTFTISNTGGVPTAPLTVALAGADAGQFHRGASSCGPALAAGASCTVDVAANPAGPGTLSALLDVTAATASTQAQLLASCCAPPELVISPVMPDFGSQMAGTTGAALVFTITNNNLQTTGAIAATLSGANAAEFQITSSTCTTLSPGMSCTVSVVFAPMTAGAKSASLDIFATPGGAPSAALTGTGL